MADPRFSFNLQTDLQVAYDGGDTEQAIAIRAEIERRMMLEAENKQIKTIARRFKSPAANWVWDGDGWPEWNGGI